MTPNKINGHPSIRFASTDELFHDYLLEAIRSSGQPRCTLIAEMLEKSFQCKNFVSLVQILREFGGRWKSEALQPIKDWQPTTDNDTGALYEVARPVVDLADSMLAMADRFAKLTRK